MENAEIMLLTTNVFVSPTPLAICPNTSINAIETNKPNESHRHLIG